MGAQPSTPPKDDNPVDFATISSEVNSIAKISIINGIDITYGKVFSPNLQVFNILSMAPRLYPVSLAPQFNEPIVPGTFSCVAIGNYLGMPFRISFGGKNRAGGELTVPVTDEANFTLTSEFSLVPAISATFKLANKYTNMDATIASSDMFRKGSVAASAGFNAGKSKVAISLTKSLNDAISMVRLGLSRPFKHFRAGALITFSDSFQIMTALAAPVNNSTSFGARFESVPSSLYSAFSFGFERNFALSKFSAAVSTDGNIASEMKRRLRGDQQFTITANVNFISHDYRFGMGLIVN